MGLIMISAVLVVAIAALGLIGLMVTDVIVGINRRK